MQHWQGADWENYYRYEYTYDETLFNKLRGIQSNLVEEIQQEWINSQWVNKQKQTYEYIPTSVQEDPDVISDYSLSQNFPNPFNPNTAIKWQIPEAGFVTLKIYDVLGREVSTLVNKELVAGKHEAVFNATGYSSGVYFYRLSVRSSAGLEKHFIQTKKMLLLK